MLKDKSLDVKFKGHENTFSQMRGNFSDDGKYAVSRVWERGQEGLHLSRSGYCALLDWGPFNFLHNMPGWRKLGLHRQMPCLTVAQGSRCRPSSRLVNALCVIVDARWGRQRMGAGLLNIR
jgi:hypothetical protein